MNLFLTCFIFNKIEKAAFFFFTKEVKYLELKKILQSKKIILLTIFAMFTVTSQHHSESCHWKSQRLPAYFHTVLSLIALCMLTLRIISKQLNLPQLVNFRRISFQTLKHVVQKVIDLIKHLLSSATRLLMLKVPYSVLHSFLL